jgi:hypothetical protein
MKSNFCVWDDTSAMTTRPIITGPYETLDLDKLLSVVQVCGKPFLVGSKPDKHRHEFVRSLINHISIHNSQRTLSIFAPDEEAVSGIQQAIKRYQMEEQAKAQKEQLIQEQLANAQKEEQAKAEQEKQREEQREQLAKAQKDRDIATRTRLQKDAGDVDRELTALKATIPAKPGFFAKLFGFAKPSPVIQNRISEWEAKKSAIEMELSRLDQEKAEFGSDPITNRLIIGSLATDQPSFSCSSDVPLTDCITNTTDQQNFSCESTPIENDTLDMSVWKLDPSLCPVYIVGKNHILANNQPVEMRDLCITVACERITESEFEMIRGTAKQHIIIGDPTLPAMTSLYRNGVPSAFRSDFFSQLWLERKTPWQSEGEKIVCKLSTAPQGSTIKSERLTDNHDIELRFAHISETESQLIEVVFPSDWNTLQAREWLAKEYDEAKPNVTGEPNWLESDKLTATWDEIAQGVWIDSVAGVRECVANLSPDSPTIAMEFDLSAGWTRDSANSWLAERILPQSTVQLPDEQFVGA